MSAAPRGRVKAARTVAIDEVHDRTAQEVIMITSDKLELELTMHVQSLTSAEQWKSSLALLVGVVVVFCTSEFKNAFGLSADTWRATFVIAGAVFLFWFMKNLWSIRGSQTVKQFIQKLKKTTES